jgi:hypothetical protein
MNDCHLRVCNFRHGSEEEQDDEQSNEASHTKVDPLHILQSLRSIDSLGEEHTRRKQRSDERSNGLDGLREIETDLRVSWWTADGKERIGCRLEGRQSGTNDEHASAETSERVLNTAGPRAFSSALDFEIFVRGSTYHMRRHPTERTQSPVMKVTRKPHLRRIQPEMVGGQRK